LAAGPFTAALLKGDALPDEERDAVAEQVHKYTGLSADYVKAANLRISEIAFVHELLKSHARPSAGSMDVTWPYAGSLQKYADYDPQAAAISAAYTRLFRITITGT